MSSGERGEPRRGEVWRAAFDPSLGGEIRKPRPATVVSNDAANRLLNRIQVVPIASKVERLYQAEAPLTVGRTRRKAMADKLTTASRQRLRGRLAKLDPKDLAGVQRAIKPQLGLT